MYNYKQINQGALIYLNNKLMCFFYQGIPVAWWFVCQYTVICYESGPYCGLCYNYDIRQVQQCDLDQFPLILMHGKHNTGRKLRIRKQSQELTKNSSAMS